MGKEETKTGGNDVEHVSNPTIATLQLKITNLERDLASAKSSCLKSALNTNEARRNVASLQDENERLREQLENQKATTTSDSAEVELLRELCDIFKADLAFACQVILLSKTTAEKAHEILERLLESPVFNSALSPILGATGWKRSLSPTGWQEKVKTVQKHLYHLKTLRPPRLQYRYWHEIASESPCLDEDDFASLDANEKAKTKELAQHIVNEFDRLENDFSRKKPQLLAQEFLAFIRRYRHRISNHRDELFEEQLDVNGWDESYYETYVREKHLRDRS